MEDIPVILLAAGQSSRMGGTDKLLRPIDGVPLLRRSAMIAAKVGPVIVALPPVPHPRYDVLSGLDVQIVEVTDAAEGMNASLRGALSHIPETARAVMILLADLPDLTDGDLRAVRASVDSSPDNLIWRGACEDGTPGHPVIFDRSLFSDLQSLKGDGGAQDIVRANQPRVHQHLLPGSHALFDLDTPEDWAAWEAAQK